MYILLIILAMSLLQCQSSADIQTFTKIRSAVKAGQFYSDDAQELQETVDLFLAQARAPLSSTAPAAIIVPHAGYIYSGQIAADAYNQARGHKYDLIILMGPNHTISGFEGISVFAGKGYQTPLGLCEIDKEGTRALISADPQIVFEPRVHEQEHSLEVQIPFIQTLFPDTPLIAAVIGTPRAELCHHFGENIKTLFAEKKILLIASTDLSHYPEYSVAMEMDSQTLSAILTLDETTFLDVMKGPAEPVPSLSTLACGKGPILTLLAAVPGWGVREGSLVSKANSGDCLLGDPDRVVGYGAVAFYPHPAPEIYEPEIQTDTIVENLTDSQRMALLQIAHQTIDQYLRTGTTPLIRDGDPELWQKQGAFVTLKKHGQLRGCIGHMSEDLPLCRVVGRMALQAAFNDRRFDPLNWDEWPDIELEVSVLTPFKPIEKPQDFIVGRDGIIIRNGGRSAVYLPQVATEQGWDREQTLQHLCQKAGLSQRAWMDENSQLFVFQADVFTEHDLK